MLTFSRVLTMFTMWLLLAICSLDAQALTDDQRSAVNPLRLSYTSGNVSFWRYGAEDWVEARINTPIVNGDALYTGPNAVFELQGEGRIFIRADDKSELTVVSQATDFLQLKVTSGRVSLDIRTLPFPGYNIEINTPNAVFTIDRAGYYRADVNGEVHFITRRGGAATMTQAKGQALIIMPSEEIVVSENGRAETYAAPEPNAWDRWNDERSNDLIDAYSDRYITPGIAGARDLDNYGNWRTTDEYGPLWVPDAMPGDWAPYSSGRWVWDPYYQWTWIDDAPWGWVPFHYGRWVNYAGFWAWAPGPVMSVRPMYAPALVAFFGVTSGGPGYGWVALGWGEPCVPWWGNRGFVGNPWWGGWGGPRVVNNVRLHQFTVVNVNNIRYSNSHVPNAIVATTAEHFGRHNMRDTSNRVREQSRDLKPLRGALPLQPQAANLVADAPSASRPPEQVLNRPVVVNKRPQEIKLPWRAETRTPNIEPRYVPAQKPNVNELRRPAPGTQFGPERARPPLPSRYEDWRQQSAPATPAAVVREPNAGSNVELRQGRDQRNTTELSRRREPTVSGVVTVPPERQQPMPQAEPLMRQPADGARERSTPAQVPVPMRIISQERPQPTAEPSYPSTWRTDRMTRPEPVTRQPAEGGRDRGASMPAPIRIAPQERPQQAPEQTNQRMQRAEPAQQQGGRSGLPGAPANRTYRDGNPGRPEPGQFQHQ